MKKIYAYWEKHASGGYTCEMYHDKVYLRIFIHYGNLDTLYSRCEEYAKKDGGRLEMLKEGLPK